jgi:site-specific recombinase XerD
MSDFCPEARQNWGDNVFKGLPVGEEEASLVNLYLESHDLTVNSRRAFTQDLRKFARWFSEANREPFRIARATVRDITDFRDNLRRNQGQAVATVNRCLVMLRRFLGWLVDQGKIPANPAKAVKQLREVRLAPKGLDRGQVRRLLREIELRQNIRTAAVICLFLYTGARVSDLINLELTDLILSARGGTMIFRFGKGNKMRTVPLPLPARRALQAYLETRPRCKARRSLSAKGEP